jgi:glutathione S-transferase
MQCSEPENPTMKLYFAPLACSLASRIVFYEAGADAVFVEVDLKTLRTGDGTDYRTVHPLGVVPALVLDDGTLLTENVAILQLLADRFLDAQLAPRDAMGRARLQQMLSFVGTELHKGLYSPLLDKKAPEGAKAYALSKASPRLEWLENRLRGSEYAIGAFSVADPLLHVVLSWSTAVPVDLAPYPAITAYQSRMSQRPSVRKAFSEERALYLKKS